MTFCYRRYHRIHDFYGREMLRRLSRFSCSLHTLWKEQAGVSGLAGACTQPSYFAYHPLQLRAPLDGETQWGRPVLRHSSDHHVKSRTLSV